MSSVRVLAQSDPVPNLTARWGDAAETASRRINSLVDALRELDEIADQLRIHGIMVDPETYLGPIGNAAAAARRDLEKRTDSPTFSLPRP